MNNYELVIMAAGIGSRYGGLKQTDAFGENGELIIDYSIYDAKRAGFSKVIFVINKKIEKLFKEKIGNKVARHIDVDYAFQELSEIPEGIVLNKDRIKPLGTAHAIYCALDKISAPFCVINSDDFYGKSSFDVMASFLKEVDDEKANFAMVGFKLSNTVSESGYVSRGVCQVNDEGYLKEIIERLRIEKKDGGIYYEEKGWHELSDDTTVSMNMWGFTSAFSTYLKQNIASELKEVLESGDLKGEYYLPMVVATMLEKGICDVKVLRSEEKWYGVTYPEDKEKVVEAIKNMVSSGKYKRNLWL